MPLQLEVYVNGQPTNLIGSFAKRADTRFQTTAAELVALGLKAPQGRRDQDLVILDEISGLRSVYDPTLQRLYIEVGDTGRTTNTYDASASPEAHMDVQSGKGAVLNYTLFGSAGSRADAGFLAIDGASASLDGRIFGNLGTLSASGIVRQLSTGGPDLLPLDATWSVADPDRIVTFRAGDIVSGGVAWSRPIRIGGLQFQRSFDLRPDLILRPLPSFSGSAVVPSTVDVYVNSAKAFSQEIPAGPFEIHNVPVVTSSGTAHVIVRDAAGRETETVAPFYASADLLRAGIYDYSVETGFARRDYGIAANAYDDTPVASISGRYGATDELTVEMHGEAAPQLINVGLGASSQIADRVLISGAASLSAHDGSLGGQLYAALQLHASGIEVRASTRRTVGNYADLGSVTTESLRDFAQFGGALTRFYASAPPKALDQVSLGLPLIFDSTRLSVTLLHVRNEEPGASSLIAAASYSRPFIGASSLFATAFHSFSDDDGLGVYAGLTMPLGEGITSSAIATRDHDGASYGVEAARSLSQEPGSFGWHVRVREGESSEQQVALGYRGTRSEIHGQLVHFDDSTSATAEISGAVVASSEGLFLANRIDDAFAVVDVGAPDVDVLFENRRVARSDADGKALVTGLRSYETAKIAIDPVNLPLNAQIDKTETRVRPSYRSGVAVEFGIQMSPRSALLVFRRSDGSFLPVGAHGRIDGQSRDFVVGYEGQAFVTGLASSNSVTMELADRKCHASFEFHPEPEMQTIIDPVVCQ